MKYLLKPMLIASAGALGVEAADVVIPTPTEIEVLGKLVIQLVIGIATIWRLIRDRDKPE